MWTAIYEFYINHPCCVGFVTGSLCAWLLDWIRISRDLPRSRADEHALSEVREGISALGREVHELRRRLLGVCLVESDQSSREIKTDIEELKALVVSIKGGDRC